MTNRRWAIILASIILITAGRVAATYRVFSQTADEPIHLAAGYDFLKTGRQMSDAQHPPLARVFFALPFLDSPPPAATDGVARGNALLLRNDRYTQNLGRMRPGNLVFVIIGIIAVALWARHLISPAAGLIAAAIFASLPPILAHGGLATTDMAVTAMVPAALYALTLLLESPSWRRAIVLGVVIAAGLLAKYSFVIYFPIAALVVIVTKCRTGFSPSGRAKARPTFLLTAAGVAFLLVWAMFRFSFGTLQAADPRATEMCANVFHAPQIAAWHFPAPDYINGAIEVAHHDRRGHRALLFGEMRDPGSWWYYFPVALFFKTPIPLMILAIIGSRRNLEIPLIALAILAVAMTSHINIGVRHVLPIYAPLSMLAAMPRLRIATFVLLAWLAVGSIAAHPDYLPWFNAFAGSHPERILNDSNLDWGQDVLRLVRSSRAMRIPQLTVSLNGTTDLDRIGLPPHTTLEAMSDVHGWLAVSEMNLAQGNAYSPAVRDWLQKLLGGRDYRRIGKTIRLYFIPPRPPLHAARPSRSPAI